MTSLELELKVDSALPVYVLVDPMTGEPLPIDGVEATSTQDEIQRAREAAWGRSIHQIVLGARIRLAPALHPYLVELVGHDDHWLQITLQMACQERTASQEDGLKGNGQSAHRMGGWIQGPTAPGQIACALSDAMTLHVKSGVAARYLRLADRRALDWIRYVVGTERLDSALATGLFWQYLDSRGRIVSMQGMDSAGGSRLVFEADEWKRVEAGPVHHATIARWCGSWKDVQLASQGTESASDQSIWPRIERAVSDAKQAATRHPERFHDMHDLAAWAALTLMHREDEIELAIKALDRLEESSEDETRRMHVRCQLIDAAILNRRG